MSESPTIGKHNADNLFRPIEQGAIEKFDALFTAREKTLRHSLAKKVKEHQEFLARTFPHLISMGAEHPQLSGGVLYIMGILSEHTPHGSEAVNSIARRFAERKHTKPYANILQPALSEIHAANERTENTPIDRVSGPDLADRIKKQNPALKNIEPVKSHELAHVVNQELARTKITRELYDFKQCPVNVSYEQNGQTIDLGTNSSEISILNQNSKTGKSMVFICSSAGNPAGAESFAVEYALKTGNKVYIIGQPDGASGHMTQAFADAAVSDAMPPKLDVFRRFTPPSFTPHTQFMKQVIQSVVPPGEHFDLYSHSGGGVMAKNLLRDPSISDRVNNAVFLNAAGVTTFDTLMPVLFRRITLLRSIGSFIRDFPNIFRYTFEKDRNESAHNAAFWFRDRVTVALQSSMHYRQPDWDKVRVNGGKVVFFVGGKDVAVGGKQFARFMEQRLSDGSNPPPSPYELVYEKNAHHMTPFIYPEDVVHKILNTLS